MSKSSSSSSQTQGVYITQEEFFAFHNIDRQFFSRLVFNLRREPAQAMQVTAFWLWLERLNMTHEYVDNILTFPDEIIDAIFEETLLCLRAAETDVFNYQDDPNDIPMIQSIIGRDGVNLRYFHENRVGVLHGIGNIVQGVCLRAFKDLIQMLLAYGPGALHNYYRKASKTAGQGGGGGGGGVEAGSSGTADGVESSLEASLPPLSSFYSYDIVHGTPAVNCPRIKVGDVSVPLHGTSNRALFQGASFGEGGSGASSSNNAHSSPFLSFPRNPYDSRTQPHILQEELMELLRGMSVMSDRNQEVEGRGVPVSERTIFLTFSKGYPISENELREFLMSSFGDIIEALHMQEVGENEQPLYARLVVRHPSAMEAVLGRQSKAKFAINGKHVWARKYVRKNPSPPSSPGKY